MKIKKAATARHEATLNPFLREFIEKASTATVNDLLPLLATFPLPWPFPRGDLYHWIPLLDRFDSLLDGFVVKYKLRDGPQTIPFEAADKEILIGIMEFTRLLVENCGNRSLYASSGYLGDVLCTTDLDVLYTCLFLCARLAQRYYTSRTRGSSSNQATLLASHYNINLDRVLKLSAPFPKGLGIAEAHGGKHITTKTTLPVYVNDLARIARGDPTPQQTPSTTTSKGKGKATEVKEDTWEDWGSAWVSYYMNPKVPAGFGIAAPVFTREPVTPSPARRSSLHQSHTHGSPGQQSSPTAYRQRGSGSNASVEESTETITSASYGGLQTLEISHSRIQKSSSLEALIKDTIDDLPADSHYEFLHRVRTASAMAGDVESRRKILGIRILAIINLAYVHPDHQFFQKILTADGDEPRRLQLAFQFAEMLQAGDGSGKDGIIPRWLQTLAIMGLEALVRHKHRVNDVTNALSLNVNHGVLMYLVRKIVAELGMEDGFDGSKDAEQWRDALFSLLAYLPAASPNAGSLLVSAGIIPLYVEMINLRTPQARRYVAAKVINQVDNLVYTSQNAFQTLANAQGLDSLVDLVSEEVKAGMEEVNRGEGLSHIYRSESSDYKITHLRQQTLKAASKFINHILTQSGANVERLLRNLIDNPKLLEAIRTVISNGEVWGSNIWSTIVTMISTFINNEPTSYAVVHEAHITHALLEAITGRPGLVELEAEKKKEQDEKKAREAEATGTSSQTGEPSGSAGVSGPGSWAETAANVGIGSSTPPAQTKDSSPEPDIDAETPVPAILPSQDAIGCIANAFGAICLNAAGLNLIKISNALDSFFEIFESPAHVKVLGEGDLDNLLGGQFDELVRHHPPLREKVISATLRMVKRVAAIGNKYAREKGVGAKIWLQDEQGELLVSGGRSAVDGVFPNPNTVPEGVVANDPDGDITMTDVDVSAQSTQLPDIVRLSDVLDEETEGPSPAIVPIVDYIDVASRFVESLVHTQKQAKEFVRRGGLESMLGFYRLPSLPHDFATSQANQTICRAVHLLCEHSMSSTLKVVYMNANLALSRLEPYLKHSRSAAFFAPLTDPDSPISSDIPEDESYDVKIHGTSLIKDLVAVHSIVYLLQGLYHQNFFTVRQSVQEFLESSQDVDREALICQLGMLQRQCVWEEILLQNHIPSAWDQATRVKDSVSSAAVAIDEAAGRQGDRAGGDRTKDQKNDSQKAIVEKDGKLCWFRNVKTIRYLIGQIPTVINPFLQGLAKCVITRRTQDPQHKYLAFKLVDAISDVIYTHLTWDRIHTATLSSQRDGYLIVMLSSLMSLLLDGLVQDSYFNTPKLTPPDQNVTAIITTVVTFKQKGGFEVMKKILNTFWEDLKGLPAADAPDLPQLEQGRMLHAYGGIRIILSLFSYLVSPKCIVEAIQAGSLHSRSISEGYSRIDYFNVIQLLVELRHMILPVVADMWEASTLEKASSPVIKTVIEILGIILKGDSELGAFTKNDLSKEGLKNTLLYRDLMPRETKIKFLTDKGYSRDASLEALRRCDYDLDEAGTLLETSAEELDRAVQEARRNAMGDDEHGDEDDEDDEDESESEGDENDGSDHEDPVNPVPVTAENPQTHPQSTAASIQPEAFSQDEPSPSAQPDLATSVQPQPSASQTQTPTPPAPSRDGVDAELAVPPPPPPAAPISRIQIDDLLAPLTDSPGAAELIARLTGTSASDVNRSVPTEDKSKDKDVEKKKQKPQNICVEDLDDLRSEVRKNLIERSLEVLQLHNDTTFELADLIKSAFAGSSLDEKKDVVSTISMSLLSLSFEAEEDIRPKAKIISSVAHLLGLILQDQQFFEASGEDLKDQFEHLVNFIKIYPGEPAPWVATILLVMEKLLAETSVPDKLKFNVHKLDEEPLVEQGGTKVSAEDQSALFDAVMTILPMVDKDEILSFSIVRVLVLLTRRRELAVKLMENNNLRKVLHMYRRQAGARADKHQMNLMIIMRHIVEDEETLKAFMRAEIRTAFATRGTRPLDTSSFTKHMSHLILRNPDVFVEVSNELLKIARYETHVRSQILVLKETNKPAEPPIDESDSKKENSDQPESSTSAEKRESTADAEPMPEEMDIDQEEKPKTAHEIRIPGVEHPDGVIHLLLTELFSIKDVRDVPHRENKAPESFATPNVTSIEQVAREPTSTPAPGESKSAESTKPEKQEVKAEDHPFHLYRAFLLMALAELVCCYNRCKIEFINFNRKAGAREPITPSKPRSAIFNYLLNDLIIQHALATGDDIEKKKRNVLALWSQGIFVSLCTHTGESSDEDEPDLLFVRKFVCEVSLKAFKDACSSSDPLDIKYPRMWALSETFYRILCGRPQSTPSYAASTDKTQLQMAKIMLDKGYVSALTSALAEMDLNFPDASKKYIKYMLKTLRLLSKRAVDLSETSSISTPGTTDDDEIMTASSMTDIDDIREETPDLYRNSTLGLFEGADAGDDDEGAESYDEGDEDEDMMYDDEMGFDEDVLDEDGSEISEDEDEGDGEGVEVIVEGDDHGADDDDSDDEDMDEDDEEIILETHHDHHHHADEYDDGDEDGWEDEGNDEDDEEDELAADDPDGVIGDRLEEIARAINAEHDPDLPHVLDDDREEGFIDDEMDEDDDMEGDEDDEDMDDDEAMMDEDYDEDEDPRGPAPWGWAEGEDSTLLTRAHPRGVGAGWFTFSGHSREPAAIMSFATRGGPRGGRHLVSPPNRDASNQNPLLQQPADPTQPMHRRSQHRHGLNTFMADWPLDALPAHESPATVINALMNLMHRGAVAPAAIHFETTVPLRPAGFPHSSMSRDMRSLYSQLRPTDPSRHRMDPDSVLTGSFEAATTSVRWSDEARLLYGVRTEECAQRIINTLLWKMVPAALEEEKIRKAEEEENRRKMKEVEEAMKKKAEEERLAKEKAEAEEKARKEEEERQAAEQARIEAEARAVAAGASAEGEGGETTQGRGITGVGEASRSAEAGPSEQPVERATVIIRDREIDITGMGIDPEFLAAIPEDMREEALTAHIRERRAEAATTNQPSEISREFLDALPEDIREELLASESADRRRREVESARAANGGGPVDIDLASFLATLDPGLRQTVLLEQDEEALAQLPREIVEEANRYRIDRGIHNHIHDITRVRGGPTGRRDEPPPPKKPVRKGTIQLLDKAGVATLLRLMFVPQQSSTKSVLSEILLNICQNRHNRAEVVNLLLSILQDGSADMPSVERSFAQISVRAKQTSTQKTPIKPGLHRTNTHTTVLSQTSGEISPLTVTQQCLTTLFFLVSYNEHIPSYFLTEHDTSTGLKRSMSRKGKGKAMESKASKFALNTLLGLLDRPLITENTTVMEQLSILLSEITRPLTILLKKEKKKDEEDVPKEVAPVTGEGAASGAGTSTETPAQPQSSSSGAETSTTAPATEGSGQAVESTGDFTSAGPSSSTTAPTQAVVSSTNEKPNHPASEEEKPKKARNLVPPVVPDHNLRLVVNILTARECSSKTYRETIATMQNLAGIPGAKNIFGIELIRQAEELSTILIGHLDALLQQIKKAENGTQVQGMALASFSPAGSEQAKLLRVLTAIDYLFDPKRNSKQQSAEKAEKEKLDEVDVLSKLHQQLAFSPLWEKLSECLGAIHEREDMLHIATILLPSMESLMVVCKTAGLDEKEQSRSSTLNPEVVAATKKLFFGFTEEHRKILNQMVRNNPKLMSGTFAQLMHNPKVLDFDNKRNFFTRKLHARQGIRDAHQTLQLNVRRDQVFMDSYRSMYYKSGDEIKYAKLNIRFSNEEGVDAGGVTREWFQVMARQMFNPGYALFVPVASDRTTFHPNHLSGVNSEHLQFFKFIGRIIGKALFEGRVLDCHFSRAVYKQILGKPVSLKDMETLDLDYYKSMLWMLENDITDVITETFSSEVDEFGVQRTIDLIPNGRNIPVTEENKHEFVRLNTEHRLLHSVKDQIDAFLQGFYDIVPANLISIFNEQELELLISGMPEIDLDDWKNNTEYHNYTASSPQIQWFWRAVRSFDKEERAKLLQFVTGTSKVPLNGFKELEGMNGFSKFNIHRDYGNKDRLPSSHTCFNQLDLPEYESYEQLRQQLLTAITQGAEYFGFA